MPYYRSDQLPLNEILSSNISYVIPEYQRKYVWGQQNWDELFEDICNYSSVDHPHFLGHVVFSSENQTNTYKIVDGQQRLVTLLLLISAIVNEFYRRDDNDSAERIKSVFLYNYDNIRIRRSEGKLIFLEIIIDSLRSYKSKDEIETIYNNAGFSKNDVYDHRQKDCLLFFCEKIKTIEKLNDLLQLLLQTEVIRITVQKDVEGYGIFETLNARGIPLQDQELLKNYIYRYMPTKTKKNKAVKVWERITDNLIDDNKDNFQNFLTHYCTYKYGKVKNNELYKTIKERYDRSNVEGLLEELLELSKYYYWFENPVKYKEAKGYNPKIYIALKYFRVQGIRQVRPVLLALFSANITHIINDNELEKLIVLFENFYFIYVTVMNNRTNQIDQFMLSIVESLKQPSINYDDIRLKLKFYIADKKSIINQLTEFGYSKKNKHYSKYSQNKDVKYFFEKYEGWLNGISGYEFPNSGFSVEHVANDDSQIDWVCKLGALLPYPPKRNSNLGSKAFSQKLVQYKKSPFSIVQKFCKEFENAKVFTEADQKSWGNKISKDALANIWDCFGLFSRTEESK